MSRARYVHIATICAGVFARIAWVLAGPGALSANVRDRELARGLAEGRGYDGAHWMPAWPAWMSIFFRAHAGDLSIMLASVALGVVTIAVTWAIAREVFGADAAWRAAGICALVPSLVLLPAVLVSENLALPLFAIATLALVRAARLHTPGSWVLFAIAAAAATYVREACLALALAGIAVAFVVRCRRACVAIAIVFGALLAPWVLRNRAVTGHAVLTTSAATNLCIGLGEGATGGFRTLGDDDANDGLRCAREGLAHHPLELVTLAPAKLSRLATWDDWIPSDFVPAETRGVFAMRAICNVSWWVLCALAALGLARSRERLARVLVAPIAAVAASIIVTFGVARFHAPLIPLLAALASGYRRRS